MAQKQDYFNWELYKERYKTLYEYGVTNNLIKPYDANLIMALRKVYYGGVPASIILLCDKLCNGYCYDRALLLSLAFGDEEFEIVDADIDGIILNPKYIGSSDPHYGNHCFVQRTMPDGSVWVYDTTLGLVFAKDLYYQMENPKITKINSKAATEAFEEYQDIKNADPKKDLGMLPMIMPWIDELASGKDHLYSELLCAEIARFKEEIGYEALCEQIQRDIKEKGIVEEISGLLSIFGDPRK